MSKRDQHIEKWLRQAAAQDPEASSDQVKQQAWGQLSNMLDSEENIPGLPRSSGFGWWVILLEVLVLVGGLAYLWGSGEQRVQKEMLLKEETGSGLSYQDSLLDQRGSDQDLLLNQRAAVSYQDTLLENGSSLSDQGSIDSHSLQASGKEIGPWAAFTDHKAFAALFSSPSGNNAKRKSTPLLSSSGDVLESTTKTASSSSDGLASSTKTASSSSDILTPSTKKSSSDKLASTTKYSSSSNHKPRSSSKDILVSTTKKPSSTSKNKQQKQHSSTSATYWNTDPLEKNAAAQRKKRSLAFTGNAPSETYKKFSAVQAAEVLQQLGTKQLFIAVKDSGVKNIPLPKASRTQKDAATEASGFSIRIAALAPIAEAYGAGVNIEYTFSWRNKWRVRPYIGAEYVTGFDKDYKHVSYTATPGSGFFRIDSTITLFPLKGMLYGKAGVQAAYVFSKWEASAGIEYRYLLATSGKEDTVVTRRYASPLPANLQPVPFNKKQVTGSGNLRLQLGLDYWISPRLQVGAIYYIQATKQKIDSTYKSPVPKLPDQTSLQIHARYYLKKR